jgi:hypothetical protein
MAVLEQLMPQERAQILALQHLPIHMVILPMVDY